MTKKELNWFKNFELAKEFFKENGHLLISQNYEINGVKLGIWIRHQRKFYKDNILTQDRIEELESINMIWEEVDNFRWEQYYNLAKEYFEVNGHLLIPQNYETAEGVKLGHWIGRQRQNKKKGLLSEEQINLLESIGMVWTSTNNTGTSFPEYLIYHISKNTFGEDKVFYRDNSLGFELDIYISSLNCAIEYDGVRFHKDKEVIDSKKDLKCKDAGITLYRIREEGLSNLENSICYSIKHNLDYANLVLELNKFFKKYFSIEVGIENFNIQEIYNEYSLFKNNYLNNNWLKKFKLAKEYFEVNGDLLVHINYQTENGINLGYWISDQRTYKKKGKLSEKQISFLENIGMVWDASKDFDQMWLNNYRLAKKYYKEHGDLLIPQNYKTEEGIKLGFWISNQRSRKMNLSQEQIDLLESIDMVWTVLKVRRGDWFENYNLSKEFFEEHGHLLIPLNYKTAEGVKLGFWISNQRSRKMNLSQEQIDLLESIDMVWRNNSKVA